MIIHKKGVKKGTKYGEWLTSSVSGAISKSNSFHYDWANPSINHTYISHPKHTHTPRDTKRERERRITNKRKTYSKKITVNRNKIN